MAKNLFNRYVWLVNTIYEAGKITFEEISNRWERSALSDGEPLPLRTFHNHRKEIEALFDIGIECNRRGGYYYYIENAEEMEWGDVRAWLLNTFAVNNLINESYAIKSRILFEEIPSGQRFLSPIIQAMRDGVALEISYKSYWQPEAHAFEIEPYCVKVFKQRWYVVGKSERYESPRVYALDRIQDLRVTDTGFRFPSDFDPKEYFHYSLGVIVDEGDPVTIRLKALGHQADYIRARPFHSSQQEVEKAEGYSVFEYFMMPTFDFYQEMLSQGPRVEILSPGPVRREMMDWIRGMRALYGMPLGGEGEFPSVQPCILVRLCSLARPCSIVSYPGAVARLAGIL